MQSINSTTSTTSTTSNLESDFGNLPYPAFKSLLRSSTDKSVVNLLTTTSKISSDIKSDYQYWVDKINEQCPEYRLAQPLYNKPLYDIQNAYNTFLTCKNANDGMTNFYINLYNDNDQNSGDNLNNYMDLLIMSKNYLDIARFALLLNNSNNLDGKIIFFLLAINNRDLNVAKLLQNIFKLTEQNVRHYLIIYNDSNVEIMKWLYSTFHYNKNDFVNYFTLFQFNPKKPVHVWIRDLLKN